MTKTAKRILIALLLIQNGGMIFQWINGASHSNDVGRQWIRIIFPVVMLIQSLATTVVVWIVDVILRKRQKNSSTEQAVPDHRSEAAPQPDP